MSKVHFILDEMASMEHLTAIDDAVDKYRGYGVRLICLFQSIGQLKKCFPDGQEQTLLSNTSQVFFGVNDIQTAEMVSARLGEETIIVGSGGTGSGSSRSWSNASQGNVSGGSSSNSNDNWQQQARKLLKPEEIIGLPPRVAITFTPGMPPIATALLRHYEEGNLLQRPSRFRRMRAAYGVLVTSAALCLIAISFAVKLTPALHRLARPTTPAPTAAPIAPYHPSFQPRILTRRQA